MSLDQSMNDSRPPDILSQVDPTPRKEVINYENQVDLAQTNYIHKDANVDETFDEFEERHTAPPGGRNVTAVPRGTPWSALARTRSTPR